jgi:8-oxo-dGTP pyrophosphatase MutT (NUDIX family)
VNEGAPTDDGSGDDDASGHDDAFAFVDEVQAIARTGLHFSENPFDRDRYTRLLDASLREYETRTTIEASAIRDRFESEIGYVTAKVGADAAVFDEDDRILLAHRADDGKWGLIAGWVDPNESPEGTVVRELAEEAGVRARVDRLVGVFFREAHAGEHPHGTVSIVYLCSITGGTLRPQLHEVSELAWRSIDDLESGEWHHHHELLARAARDARWRMRAGL